MDKKKQYGQYFTPVWAAEELYRAHFGHLGSADLLIDPTCGIGNMIMVVPQHVRCIGIELDSELAIQARLRTKRTIIEGDCRMTDISAYGKVTAVFGNPPFELSLFEQIMSRLSLLLDIGRKAGFILPAYFFQTSHTTYRMSRRWSICQEMLPRDVFFGLSKPIVFATFIRDNTPQLVGFRLFEEASCIKELSEATSDILINGKSEHGSIWKIAVQDALQKLGGKATVSEVYSQMRDNRPTKNEYWKEKIRQTLQRYFTRVEKSTYAVL